MNNIERIKSMSLEEMAECFEELGLDDETFGCATCTSYGTHHYPDDCGNCEYLKCECDIKQWLKQQSKAKGEEE